MGGLLNFIASLFSARLTAVGAELGFKSAIETAKFVAWKSIIVFLVFSGSIIAVSNILHYIFTQIVSLSSEKLQSVSTEVSNPTFTITLTDFGAYLASALGLDVALGLIVSAVIARYLLNFIPFMRI